MQWDTNSKHKEFRHSAPRPGSDRDAPEALKPRGGHSRRMAPISQESCSHQGRKPDLIMQDWFQHLAKHVLVFCNGYTHHSTAWGG